eukprot:CAMPEP_0202693542 /NCGR_PEP_ID=MMETSP1385-20130828/7620_1 /ASSEMBLY_ACC=CAM_ASM_000861 /TAXON_ID=933848 /ORGANISM="Elphidium margaritaceum" /LENGTH=530 /DNA_ID=CAMNT_0049349233 /DNA_START=18 /DNA_END=1610 /DNA_ORIENTATION=-
MTANTNNCKELQQEEFVAIKSVSSSSIRFDQLKNAIDRVNRCRSRLQLRFPIVFRCGVLLQFLTRFIKCNTNIVHFCCGLSENYAPGFYALAEIMQLPHITRCHFRIDNLSYATPSFFDMLATAQLSEFSMKFDECSDENMQLLSRALIENEHLQKFTFACQSFSDAGIRYFTQIISNPRSNIHSLALSVDDMKSEHVDILCDEGFKRSSAMLTDLDIEDCKMGEIGMAKLTQTLSSCSNIKHLTIGNNGSYAMRAFFKNFGDMQYIEKLICNESQIINYEKVDLNLVALALERTFDKPQFNRLSKLQLPLFIFHDTSDEWLQLFVNALCHPNSRVRVLQIFPLFEHLDRISMLLRDAMYCSKIAHFFKLLFHNLSSSKCLQKLYIELIGSESFLFNESVANAFMYFLQHSHVNEIYVPFCCLIDYNARILDTFQHCKRLISIRDDTMDYHWLEERYNTDSPYSLFIIDAEKERQLVKAAAYHRIAHKQCSSNVANAVLPFIGVHDLAMMISTFCGVEANPDDWLTEHEY